MPEELYVKAWFLFVVIGVLIVAVTGTVIYYGEAQKTQSLVEGITDDFNTKLITLQTNQSIALSQLANDFARLSANSTAKLEQQAIQITQLTNDNQNLQTTYDELLVEYNYCTSNLQNITNNVTNDLNMSWVSFMKNFQKGLYTFDISEVGLFNATAYFETSYDYLNVGNDESYTKAQENATQAISQCTATMELINTTASYIVIANSTLYNSWITPYVTLYDNITSTVGTMLGQLKQTNIYLSDICTYYFAGNSTGMDGSRVDMLEQWSFYNVSYSNYQQGKNDITSYVNNW